MKVGVSMFTSTPAIGNVQAMYVLTDGQPNYMCPPQGYVPKLRQLLSSSFPDHTKTPSIHTFGFGYDIRSGLMKAIAKVGNGSYAFIPDASMIGTVFVHAVANLYATFATCVKLEIQTSENLGLVCPRYAHGETAIAKVDGDTNNIVVELGNLQNGQSRDILFMYTNPTPSRPQDTVSATLSYTRPCHSLEDTPNTVSVEIQAAEDSTMPTDLFTYHSFRHQLIDFLLSLCPAKSTDTYYLGETEGFYHTATKQLSSLLSTAKSTPYAACSHVKPLLSDLSGQIALSLEPSAYERWGRHYLLSLLHTHSHQTCNSFKDPGPLQYGNHSPLFVRSRDLLDAAFDSLPAPTPSIPFTSTNTYPSTPVNMRQYNNASYDCFLGSCTARLADGAAIQVHNLRPNMTVWTPAGPRRVAAVVETTTKTPIELCRLGKLIITPWHPIQHSSSPCPSWIFPIDHPSLNPNPKSNPTPKTSLALFPPSTKIYSVLLSPSPDPLAHAIAVEGTVCATLGHGITPISTPTTTTTTDARTHAFFGNYTSIHTNLERLPRFHGMLQSSGMYRDAVTGLACGFISS